jgi:hypothetical protein
MVCRWYLKVSKVFFCHFLGQELFWLLFFQKLGYFLKYFGYFFQILGNFKKIFWPHFTETSGKKSLKLIREFST